MYRGYVRAPGTGSILRVHGLDGRPEASSCRDQIARSTEIQHIYPKPLLRFLSYKSCIHCIWVLYNLGVNLGSP